MAWIQTVPPEEAPRCGVTTARPTSPPDRAMLDFAVRLTTQPARLTADDLQGLRAAGFDDSAVLRITLIAAWFNYINRVADPLGVEK